MAMEAQATPAELSDFEKKGEKIWAELVNDTNVRVEDIVKKAEDSLKERKMDAAGLLFDAASKKLEQRKMALISVADVDAMGDVIKNQLLYMTKAGDAVLKYLDKTEDILLFKKLDETAEKSFNEYSVALQFVRKLLVDATEMRNNAKFASRLKEVINDADILLMKSYFKPKFNTWEENTVNRKLCGRAMKEFLEANGEEVLNGDDAHDLWLILQQLDHPLYKDFLQQQIAFEQLRFPDNTLVVDPYGSACFKTVQAALDFAIKDAKFAYVRFLLGSEKSDYRTKVSILVQPEVYKDDLKWRNVPRQMDIDIVGNVGLRKYAEAKDEAHPASVVLKQTGDKLPEVKELAPWVGLLQDLNQSLRLARLELINESPDPLRPTLFVSPGSPVEVTECLLRTAEAECVVVKGKGATLKITGSAIEKSAKAYQVESEGKLILNECRIEEIRGGIGDEDGAGGCNALDSGVVQVAETDFIKAKQVFFTGDAKGIFNKCTFRGHWAKSVDTTSTGSIYKGVCLEERSRVSIQNSNFERFEVALFAIKADAHAALGHCRITESVKVGAEICEDASATLRNNEIDSDLILALFSNSKGKVSLENNTSTAKAARRLLQGTKKQIAAASVLVDTESLPPTMIGPQYETMDISCGEKEDTQTMMKRLMKEKKEEMARERAMAEAAAGGGGEGEAAAATAEKKTVDTRAGTCKGAACAAACAAAKAQAVERKTMETAVLAAAATKTTESPVATPKATTTTAATEEATAPKEPEAAPESHAAPENQSAPMSPAPEKKGKKKKMAKKEKAAAAPAAGAAGAGRGGDKAAVAAALGANAGGGCNLPCAAACAAKAERRNAMGRKKIIQTATLIDPTTMEAPVAAAAGGAAGACASAACAAACAAAAANATATAAAEKKTVENPVLVDSTTAAAKEEEGTAPATAENQTPEDQAVPTSPAPEKKGKKKKKKKSGKGGEVAAEAEAAEEGVFSTLD